MRTAGGWFLKRRKGRHFADTLVIRTGEMLPTGRPKERFIPIGKVTKAKAEGLRTKYLSQLQRGEFVEPSTLTVGDWLHRWLEEIVPSKCRPSTIAAYTRDIDGYLIPALGAHTLQALRPGHLTQFYFEHRHLAKATLARQHAIVSGALKSAVRQGLVVRNVATLVDNRPKVTGDDKRADAVEHCWTREEAVKAITAAKTISTQLGALVRLAIDSGMRKSELGGLRWRNVDLEKSGIRVVEQLTKAGTQPEWGATKSGGVRTITIDEKTVEWLREHKRVQAALKMRNRTTYKDLDLVFAKEWGDLHGRADSLGLPLAWNNIGGREFKRVITAAKVRRIKFHGLRHTSATLLLGAGEPAYVVKERLGHKKVATTLEIYAHVLPSHQQQAAKTMGGLLG